MFIKNVDLKDLDPDTIKSGNALSNRNPEVIVYTAGRKGRIGVRKAFMFDENGKRRPDNTDYFSIAKEVEPSDAIALRGRSGSTVKKLTKALKNGIKKCGGAEDPFSD